MNLKILRARDEHDHEAVILAHRQLPRWSAWELAKLLDLDEATVKAHLNLTDHQDAA